MTEKGLPQHVWVSLDDRWHERKAGVVAEWRRRPDGTWEAYVLWASGGGNVRWSVHQQWLSADQVRPREPSNDEERPRSPGEG